VQPPPSASNGSSDQGETSHECLPPTWAHLLGFLALSIGFCSAAVLSAAHLTDFTPPGCGAGNPCAEAAASRWGSIVGWPTSYLGVAWFGALLVAWTQSLGRGISRGLIGAARIGVLVAAGLVTAMMNEKMWCPYCLATHAAGFIFWVILEGVARRTKYRATSLAPLAAFAMISIGLGIAEWARSDRVMDQTESAVNDSITRLSAATGYASAGTGFTGRYRLGPEVALARLVIFSDYQCGPCRRVEEEVSALLRSRPDVSLSVKHYPLCRDCNAGVQQDIHPQACRAARAAEAAGMIQGDAGFFSLHSWLFARAGVFSDAELTEELGRMGLDEAGVQAFFTTMNGEETLRRIRADTEEGRTLELKVTPLVFINGIDFPGWFAEKAITRAVQVLADKQTPARSSSSDRPATGLARDVQHWLAEETKALPTSRDSFARGPADAPVRLVFFGNYRGNLATQAWKLLDAVTKQRSDVRLEFHPFPMSTGCNPALKRDAFPGDCRLTALAVAAGRIDGAENFWKLHDWLLSHPQSGRPEGDAAIRAASLELGIDTDALFIAAVAPETMTFMASEVSSAAAVGITYAPTLFINGRQVKEWSKPGVIESILDHARVHP
jgi:protein-disulfide isomerase/uncharacterized membrane protein